MTDQLIYGVHAVRALLNNPYRTIKKLVVQEDAKHQRLQALCEQATKRQIAMELQPIQVLNTCYPNVNHQGIVAIASPQPLLTEKDLPTLLDMLVANPLILILDGITDPHNLGAALRTADATGVDFVIIPKDKSAPITPVVTKVACGAAESIPIVRVTNLVRAMTHLKEAGIWIYGAAGEATTTLYEMDCRHGLAVVMGAEGQGLRRLTREHCDGLFALPMHGQVESLNISVATGVTLYEIIRQRQFN